MFAYCNNNPCNYGDPNGHMIQGRSEFGPNAMNYKSGAYRYIVPDLVREQEECDKQAKSITNTDPYAVLESDDWAFYKGALVIRASLGTINSSLADNAFSFGVIVLGENISATQSGVDLLNHEYGHYLHFLQIGVLDYTKYVAIPSVICSFLNEGNNLPVSYYDLPWEYIADYYGGVDRGNYSSITPYIAAVYDVITIVA